MKGNPSSFLPWLKLHYNIAPFLCLWLSQMISFGPGMEEKQQCVSLLGYLGETLLSLPYFENSVFQLALYLNEDKENLDQGRS